MFYTIVQYPAVTVASCGAPQLGISDQLRCGVLAQAPVGGTSRRLGAFGTTDIALGDTVTLQGGGWAGEVCEVMRVDEEGTAAFRVLASGKTYTRVCICLDRDPDVQY